MEWQLQECKVTASWAEHLFRKHEELVGSCVARAPSGLESYTGLPNYPLSRNFLQHLLHSHSLHSDLSTLSQ